jgi:hypothetical protein
MIFLIHDIFQFEDFWRCYMTTTRTFILETSVIFSIFLWKKKVETPDVFPLPCVKRRGKFPISLDSFFIFFFFNSCCSHLEHSASVKRFVSLQFLNLRQPVGLLGRGISWTQGRYLTQTQNKHRHPCLECDSNPRSKCSSGRRQFMP